MKFAAKLLLTLCLLSILPIGGQAPQPVLTLPAGSNEPACSATVTKSCVKEFLVKVGAVEKGRIAYVQGTLSYPIPSAMLTGLAPGVTIAVSLIVQDEYGVTKQQGTDKTLAVPAPYIPSFWINSTLAWGQSSTVSGTANGGTAGGTGSDTTAPTITPNPPTTSNGIGSITTTSAIITVTTDELAVCRLRYGTSTGVYGTTLAYESSQALSHPLSISSLSANTQYFGVVDCKDAVPNTRTSSEWTFTTQAAGASDPLYGSGSTSTLTPPNRYYMEIASINCTDPTCTVDVTATFNPHGLNVNDRIKVFVPSDATGCPTTGSGVVRTVASVVDDDTFTFAVAGCTFSSSAAGAFVMWMPAWNDGDVYTATPGSTPVRRLCNFEGGASYRIAYSPWFGVSPDGTMVIVMRVGGGVAILNIANCTFVRTNTEASAQQLSSENDNPRWLNAGSTACPGADPCLIFFKSNSGQIRVWDVRNSASSSLYDTLSGYTGLSLGRTGELDSTADKVCITGTVSASSFDFFSYTVSTKTKGAVFNATTGADFCQIVDDGTFAIFTGTQGTGTFQGVQLYDAATASRLRQLTTLNPHGTVRKFSDGNSYLVGYDGGATECSNSSLFAKRTTDLAKTCLFTSANPGTDRTLGISDASGAHPNFILYNYEGPRARPVLDLTNAWKSQWTNVYQAEVGLIKWPATGSITNFRLVHHWQRMLSAGEGGYNNFPHGTMNRNATVIVFNSFDTCGATPAACTPKGTVGSTSYPMGFGVMKPFDNGNP